MMAGNSIETKSMAAEEKRRKIEPVNSIFLAYKSRNWDGIEAILAVEPLAVNDKDEHGMTLLMLEVTNPEHVEYLLEIGADPHLRCDKGLNALFYAVLRHAPLRSFEILSQRNVDPNCEDCKRTTTLIHAIEDYRSGDDEKIRLLLAAGADPTCEDSLGRSALMCASVKHAENSVLNKMLVDAMVQNFYRKVKIP
ncbi:hypothetical protein B566_EDAN015037 [Ephemera danica]|nr:hypothetical protein B566_EDAN015037 [Ephemera danica]